MNEPGSGPPAADAVDDRPFDDPRGLDRGAGVLATLALVWLAALLWAAYGSIGDAPDGSTLALTQAALALPTVISAALVAGAAVAVAAVTLLARRRPAVTRRTLPRLAVGLTSGTVVGSAALGLILFGYGDRSSTVVLAVAVLAAHALGGALAAIRPTVVLAAAVAGTLGWFALGLVQGAFHTPLLRLFGARDTAESWYAATGLLLFAVSLLGGLVAGLVAYGYLRRRGDGLHWPAYLAAGAGPGLFMLLSTAVTRLGGGHLLNLASGASEADATGAWYRGTASLSTDLVLLFVGAIAATVAFGRGLPARG